MSALNLDRLKIDRPRPSRRPPLETVSAPAPHGYGSSGRLLQRLLLGIIAAGAVWAGVEPLRRLSDDLLLPRVRLVRVERIAQQALLASSGLAANGYLVADRRAALSADTPGRVVELLVSEGSTVERGAVVARLYADEALAALRRSEQELELAWRQRAQREAELAVAAAEIEQLERAAAGAQQREVAEQAIEELARRRVSRLERLVAREAANSGDLDDARDQLRAASARCAAANCEREGAAAAITARIERREVEQRALATASSAVDVAAAAVEQARATLDKTVVRAPFAGVVALVDAEVGEVVSPSSGGGSNARGSLITLVDMLSIEAQVELPQANLAGISLEMPATIVLDAYPAQPYAGRVTRIWPEANRQKATIELRVTIHAPDARLKPELGVRVIFAAQESPATAASPEAAPGLGVPEQAIVRDEGRDKIWRVERGVARLVLVEVTRRVSGLAHIARGLVEGDEVITDPPARLTDGDRVRTLR